MTLPEKGLPADDVMAALAALRTADLPTHGGRTWAYVYDSGLPEVDDLAGRAMLAAAGLNGLDPTVFPSLLTLENDVVGAAAALLGGGPGTVGSVTSGGTESILLAVKAARDAHPSLGRPNIVVPTTAHAAFAKAAEFLRVGLVSVPVDPSTFRADPAAMAAALDDSTVLVVASAPSYAHGVVDPVPAIAAAASARGIRCHVDACIGGWVLPYFRRLGADVPPFDLSVPGVTSLSVDLHKYAYAPKGVSVLLHADAALRRTQYFAYADWPGYPMVNATVQSTKSAAPLAAAWAVLRHLGDAGYAELASVTLAATRSLVDGLTAVDGLRVLGTPEASLVAFTSDDPSLDLFVLADEMRVRGWYVQPQFAFGDLPANLHLTVTAASAPGLPGFLADLAASADAARVFGPALVDEGLAAAIAALDPDTLTPEQFAFLLQGAGLLGESGGMALPERMAPVNALLATAPARLRERLLTEFLGHLYTP